MPKAAIIYDSRSGNTGMMAKAIEEGIRDADIEVLCKRAVNATVEDVRDADAVVLGSPTYHRDMMASMKKFLFEMEKTDLKGKIGAAFGSYGWSGESIQMLTDTMKHIFGMHVVEPGLRILRRPTEDSLEQCRGFGREIARKVKQ
jgi:flavodoxin short chain